MAFPLNQLKVYKVCQEYFKFFNENFTFFSEKHYSDKNLLKFTQYRLKFLMAIGILLQMFNSSIVSTHSLVKLSLYLCYL